MSIAGVERDDDNLAITLIADEPMPFQVDGDALDLRAKVLFRNVPAAIAVVTGTNRRSDLITLRT